MLPDSAPDSDSADQKFYAPKSWFSQHVTPWLLFALFSALLVFFWQDGPHSYWAHVGFGLGQAFLLWVLHKWLTDKSVPCFTIGADQVTKEADGQINTLLFSEIKGFSEEHSKEGSFTLLKSLNKARPSIMFTRDYPDYDRMREVLARHVTDFDAPERARHEQAMAHHTNELLQDVSLGPTPNARQATLDRAVARVAWLWLAALPLGLWLLIGWPYELVMLLGLAMPLLALAALWRHRGAVSFATDKDDPRPDVLVPILIPSVVMAMRQANSFDFLTWQPLWPLAGAVAGVFALLLLLGSWHNPPGTASPLKQVGLAVLVALCYGLSAVVVVNCAFDGQRTTRHLAHVTDKYQTHGKGSSDYLMLTPWGPPNAPQRISVGRDYYNRKQPGDTVTLRLYHGRLGADWVAPAVEE